MVVNGGTVGRIRLSRAPEDVLIESLIGWEVVSKVWPTLPPPSTLLKRRPRWQRYAFAGALAVVVVFHLDCLTGATCEPT